MFKQWVLMVVMNLLQIYRVECHGRLMDPPARNSMWRFGYPNPVNYDDSELWCGGRTVQYETYGGKCGVCGDSWGEQAPRQHEFGGFFTNGLLGRRYAPGQVIDIEVEITANHMGYFELKLCPFIDSEDQDCFDRYPLQLVGTDSSRFYIPLDSKKTDIFNYKVKLPDRITCHNCVIQWHYQTGNTWGDCGNGTSFVGCGPQEIFRNCADIAIISNTPGGNGLSGQHPQIRHPPQGAHPTQLWIPTKEATFRPLVVRSQVCVARNSTHAVRNDNWCMANCLKYPPSCPETDCQCLTECVATGEKANEPGTDVYCHIHCLRFPVSERCPEWCSCS